MSLKNSIAVNNNTERKNIMQALVPYDKIKTTSMHFW